ncbi:hypothetical protein GGI04_003989 [Coemansia thaxteri]|uniref:Uncharacterized protein n=1 Tax=Coemansia thaxteri TaxID=2663907 RepID=A0A9W8BKX3_9FUNG|nr:hypothetical protein GGI04_003989 [Coemansia thaxteri]KAJ2004501.1 hypothetical protein H4R26_002483 [Coemansia thaxteri]
MPGEDDLDVSRLLVELRQRRSQAAALARALEQSVHVNPSELDSDRAFLSQAEEDIDGPSSCSSPAEDSFLEGFTQDFVDEYRPEPRTTRLIWEVLAERESESEVESEVESGKEIICGVEPGSGVSKIDCFVEPCAGVSKIDYEARRRVWDRTGDGGKPARAEYEARVAELVERALDEEEDEERDGERDEEGDEERDKELYAERDRQSQLSASKPEDDDALQAWVDGEWELWAVRASSGGSDSGSALEWVHALQAGAWGLGFRDSDAGRGKVRRTYAQAGLALQAYADGAVKRSAELGHGRTATTLFYANGDWSCAIVAPHAAPRAFYYYCHERVWHQSCDGRSEYTFADGRVAPAHAVEHVMRGER